MGSSDRKVHSLKIDTTSINGASNNTKQLQHDTNSSLPSLSSWSDENDTEEDFIESPKHLIHDWHTNKVTQDDMLPTSTDHHQQSPTLLLLDSKKKKWFQTSRSALKRYLSTPPTRCGYGGLRAGSVEPPQPPLQLLFNLQWSTSKQDDVNNHASSTPNSPVLKRYSHTARPDFIPSCPTHASNPCVFLCKAQVTRRSSLPVPELPTKCHQKKKIFVRSLTRSPGSLLSFDDEFDIPTLYFSDGEPVIRFSNIKSRKHKLLRKISSKPDYNALCIWRSNLNEALIKKRQHMTDSFKKTVVNF
jgi:hypothetical protein